MSVKNLLILYITSLFFVTLTSNALQPPTEQQIAEYKKHGILKQKITQAEKYGNHKVSPHLLSNASRFINHKMGISEKVKVNKSIPGHRGLPSTGDVKTFTLLLDFPDAVAPAHQTTDVIQNHIYGDGVASRYPLESLTNYYKRASYEQLNISGNVLGWYTTSYPRSEITDARKVIKEALTHLENQGHDFSQYDNDGDGYIDYFSVVWTGEIGAWASLWWGWQSSFYDPDYKLSGKELAAFSWQWLSYNNASDDFDPLVLIHETGHGLGLPDYYDYDAAVGPVGGVGGLDMMHGNWGDHGAFSKFILGWIEPEVVGSGSKQISLKPSSHTQDALIIMPELTIDKTYSEYFVVQNRDQTLNDSNFPNEGLLIWHVDATATEQGFVQNNSYTDHKLIRLMEADGLEQIEQGLGADAGDYFQTGQEFSTVSIPNSQSYKNLGSGVEIKNINKINDTIEFTANIATLPDITFTNLDNLQTVDDQQLVNLAISPNETINKVTFYMNDKLLSEDTSAPYSASINTTEFDIGEIKLSVEAFTNEGTKNSAQLTLLKLPKEPTPLVISLSQSNSTSALMNALNANAKTVITLSDIPVLNKLKTPVIFIDNTNSQGLTDRQVVNLTNFINSGGHVYYENVDWYWAGETLNQQLSMLGIKSSFVWSQEVSSISGAVDTPVYGITYNVPEGSYQLYTELVGNSEPTAIKSFWQLDTPTFDLAITNQIGEAKILATTSRFSDIPVATRQLVMSHYLSFFGETATPVTAKVNVIDTQVSNTENGGGINIELQKSFDDGMTTEVTLRLESITAVEGVDYQPLTNTTIEFNEEQTSYTVFVEFINNVIDDGDRQLKLIVEGDHVGQVTESIITIVDEDVPGNVKFAMEGGDISEDSGVLEVKVFHYGDGVTPHTIRVKTVSNSAIAGADFDAINEEYTFAGNEYNKSFHVKILNNELVNETRNFSIEIESNYKTDDYQPINFNIVDDENRGEIKFEAAQISQSENSGTVDIVVNRIGGSDEELDFALNTIDGTAKAGIDFTELNNSFTFLAGETSKLIHLELLDNNLLDATREFQVNILSEHLHPQAQALTVSIKNDDIRGELQFSVTSLSVVENSASAQINIERIDGTAGEIDYMLSSVNGTAVDGIDFIAINAADKFSIGESSKTITIDIIDNNNVDSERQFELVLASEHLASDAQRLTITITNDDIAVIVKPAEESSSGGGLLWLLIVMAFYYCSTKRKTLKL